MSGFVDFAKLKEAVQYGTVVAMLGLALKQSGNQWRGPCPVCENGGPRALVITEGKGFFCFASHKGGDQIALVAHVRGIAVKDAAQEIAEHAGLVQVPGRNSTSSRNSTVPESEKGQQGARTLQPLSYLEARHEAVEAVGFDPAVAERLGIGYAPKGIMRGTVAVPIRDERGTLLGYIGITEAKLPADFTGNVVNFPKSA